jgi:hypothetical protein
MLVKNNETPADKQAAVKSRDLISGRLRLARAIWQQRPPPTRLEIFNALPPPDPDPQSIEGYRAMVRPLIKSPESRATHGGDRKSGQRMPKTQVIRIGIRAYHDLRLPNATGWSSPLLKFMRTWLKAIDPELSKVTDDSIKRNFERMTKNGVIKNKSSN